MDRWLFSFITAGVLSAWWVLRPPPELLPLLTIFALTCWLRTTRWQCLGAAILSIIWVASVGHSQHRWQQTLLANGTEHWLEGTIATLVDEGRAPSFVFDIHSLNRQRVWPTRKIRLSWYNDAPDLALGQTWRFKVRLKPFRGFANEGSADTARLMLAQGLHATGYVVTRTPPVLLDTYSAWRQRLSDRLQVMSLTQHRWISALLLGDRRFLTPQDWRMLQRTGTAHLMAISGMHLAVVGSLIYLALSKLLPWIWLRFGVSQKTNLRSIILFSALCVTLLYAGISGFALPVVRAWLGLAVVVIVLHQRLYLLPHQMLMLVVAVLLSCFPNALMGASFWLSISAVSGLIFCHWRFAPANGGKPVSAFLALAALQWRLMFILLPMVAMWFGMVSFSSLVANVLAIPVVTVILVPLCLLALPFLALDWRVADGLLWCGDVLMGWMIWVLNTLAEMPYSAGYLPQVPPGVWGMTSVAILLAFLPKLPLPRGLTLLFLVPLLTAFLPSLSPRLRLDVLDVGQGSAAVLSRGTRAVVFDVGAAWEQSSMAFSVLLPFLRARGISRIDKVVISHLDNDHAGALDDLVTHFDVKSVLSPLNGCQVGHRWQWHGLSFKVLWPPPNARFSRNNGSCVVKVEGQGVSILFSGDIETLAEWQVMEMHSSDTLGSTILIAPHHGSRTSSSQAFVQAVMPEHVVFSHGYMNQWNFPVQEVVNRYVKAGAVLHSTAESGQISFVFSQNHQGHIEVEHFRDH